MAFQRVILVFPSYGLDDFPESLDSKQAENLHAAITAIWHPELLSRIGVVPEWKRADSSALDVDDSLVVIPEVSADKVDEILLERLVSQNSQPVHVQGGRPAVLQQIAKALNTHSQDTDDFNFDDSESVDAENNINELLFSKEDFLPVGSEADDDTLTAQSSVGESENHSTPIEESAATLRSQLGDFYALGYLVLQVQMLTSKSRYSSTMNQPLFEEQVTKAARAFTSNNQAECDLWLQSAFDAMSQERDQYFSSDISLIDVTLVSDATIGKSIDRQLANVHPTNLVVAADVLENLSSANSNGFSKIQAACANGIIEVTGGLAGEAEAANFTRADWQRQLSVGADKYERLGVNKPKTFAMLTGQFRNWLPSVLRDSGFESVLLQSFTDGKSPITEQSKSIWKGPDERTIDALSGPVCDAANVNDLMTLGSKLSNQIDYHHAPTLLMVHWPGQSNAALRDLIRVTRRSNALGKWRLSKDYFESTQRPYSSETFPRSDFPSSVSDSHRSSLELLSKSATTLTVLAEQVAAYLKRSPPNFSDQSLVTPVAQDETTEEQSPLLLAEDAELIRLLRAVGPSEDSFSEKLRAVLKRYSTAKKRFAAALAGVEMNLESVQHDSAASEVLMSNPFGTPTRSLVKNVGAAISAGRENRVYAVSHDASIGKCDAIVDVPPLGYVFLKADDKSGFEQNRKRSVIANETGQLSNEFLQCQIDASKNRLAGVFIPNRRGNLLAGQLLATRKNAIASETIDIRSVANNQTALQSSQTLSGQLAIAGQPVCDFIQTFQLERGSRTLDVSVQLNNVNSNAMEDLDIVWRTAWASEAATIVGFDEHYTHSLPRITSAADRILITDSDHKFAFAFSNNCQHRRVEYRYLDSVLRPKGIDSKSSHLRFSISIDPPQPWAFFDSHRLTEACQFAVAQNDVDTGSGQNSTSHDGHAFATKAYGEPLAGRVAYLFSISTRSVGCDLLASIVDSNKTVAGVRIRVTNHSDTSVATKMECLRPVDKAYKIVHGTSSTVTVDGDRVGLSLKPFEVANYDLIWTKSSTNRKESSNG